MANDEVPTDLFETESNILHLDKNISTSKTESLKPEDAVQDNTVAGPTKKETEEASEIPQQSGKVIDEILHLWR